MSVHRSFYAAVVVGGGAAGITVVGNLLDRKVGPILWVDADNFNAGRVNQVYRDVPSNTKTKLFIDFAEAIEPLRHIVQTTPSPNAMDTLRSFDQGKGCKLGYAADMLLMLTEGLARNPAVQIQRGRVASATLDQAKGWTVDVQIADGKPDEMSKVIAKRVILCTGSAPSERKLPVDVSGIQNLHLDTALAPTKLAETLPRDSPITVAVIGASHSAILALRNLSDLALNSHPQLRLKWFTRHELRYAKPMKGIREGEPDWILRDNTGLKGEAADWARENLEDGVFSSSPVSRVAEKIAYDKAEEDSVLKQNLTGCEYVVQAIGYTRNPLPKLKRGVGTVGGPTEAFVPVYDPLNGSFAEDGQKVPGLYGAGIAFPERRTDPYSNVEYAVGFWKFMGYIKNVSKQW